MINRALPVILRITAFTLPVAIAILATGGLGSAQVQPPTNDPPGYHVNSSGSSCTGPCEQICCDCSKTTLC